MLGLQINPHQVGKSVLDVEKNLFTNIRKYMTLKELSNELDIVIQKTPYSRNEIALLWKQEDENIEPHQIMALAAAIEYLNKKGNEKEYKYLCGRYEKMLDELKEQYSIK